MTYKCLHVLSLILLVFSSSFVHQGCSDPDLSHFLQGLSEGSVASLHDTMQCMQKLIPCKPYVKDPVANPPPATCCAPLKEMVTSDAGCLCQFFNDSQILNSLNVTQDDALKLPKACGFDVDVSTCEHEARAPAVGIDISGVADAVSDTSSTETSGSTQRSTHFGVVAAFSTLMISLLFSE